MTTFKTIISVAIGLTSIVSSATAVLAAPAASTTTLNVRSGPGTGFGVLDTLAPGEVVDVTECVPSGWCHVTHSGPNGWVSGSYLAPVTPPPTPPSPDCSFGITIGPSGPDFSINCGGTPTPTPTPPTPTPPTPTPPAGDEACFYTGINYGGDEFCYGVGTRNTLNATFNDEISSVRLFGAAKARLCTNVNLTGSCVNVTANAPILEPAIANQASSLRVHTGLLPVPLPLPIPLPTPVPSFSTYSTGPIELPQTFRADLDSGAVGGSGTDIWFRAATPSSRFITPVNGASLALGDGSNRGFAGCFTESFDADPVPLEAVSVGTYVCAKTGAGRISQFRINAIAPSSLSIGYTTWSH